MAAAAAAATAPSRGRRERSWAGTARARSRPPRGGGGSGGGRRSAPFCEGSRPPARKSHRGPPPPPPSQGCTERRRLTALWTQALPGRSELNEAAKSPDRVPRTTGGPSSAIPYWWLGAQVLKVAFELAGRTYRMRSGFCRKHLAVLLLLSDKENKGVRLTGVPL